MTRSLVKDGILRIVKGGLFRRLAHDNSGVTVIETAFITPIILLMGMAGLELANFALVNMRLNQAAVHISDNTSRVGSTGILSAQRVDEADINDLLIGLNYQAGESIDLFQHGRVIVSSLEQNTDGGQWIHWQRCQGELDYSSAYGPEGTGESGTAFSGMGPPGAEVRAPPGSAVIYVEIAYEYQPIIGNQISSAFVQDEDILTESTFIVRSSRDLTRLYHQDDSTPQATCDKFDNL